MGLGLSRLRLTSQMQCLHFYQSENSPLRTSRYPGLKIFGFLFIKVRFIELTLNLLFDRIYNRWPKIKVANILLKDLLCKQ